MRSLLLLLVCSPLIVKAQINRSANELAREKVEEFIETKLFPGNKIQRISFGDIKLVTRPGSEIVWMVSEKFEIAETQLIDGKASSTSKTFYFSFYLDKRLKVLAAESYAQLDKS